MKYTPDLFLLPDGTPMDAQEIASMLNSWAGSPDVGKKPAVKCQFTPSDEYMSMPIMTRCNIGVTLFDNQPQYESVRVKNIPVYKEDMIDFLMHKVDQHNRLGQNITAIAVGYDIWVNLERNVGQNRRMTYHASTPSIITLIGPHGQITIYYTNTPGQIDMLYSRANEIREFNE